MKIKCLLAGLLLCNAWLFSPAFASESALGSCMVDSMTGKERKEMAKWVFFAMASHPEIKEYSRIPEKAKVATDEHIANVVTRLLAEDCLSEARVGVKQEGQVAIVNAFELVGRVAMQELMTNKDVIQSIGEYAKYLDNKKMGRITAEE